MYSAGTFGLQIHHLGDFTFDVVLCTLGQVVGVVHPPPTTAWDNLIKDWLNWIWRHTMSQLLQSIFTPGRRERAGGGKFQKTSPQGWWFFPPQGWWLGWKGAGLSSKIKCVCVCPHMITVPRQALISDQSVLSHQPPPSSIKQSTKPNRHPLNQSTSLEVLKANSWGITHDQALHISLKRWKEKLGGYL